MLQTKAAPALARPAPVSAPPAALPTVPAVSASLPGQRDDTPKVIAIETMGMSSATYTFPALTGDAAGTKPQCSRWRSAPIPKSSWRSSITSSSRSARYPNEIALDSHQKGGMVRLSMRIEDHDTLVKFLRLELFGRRKSSTY